MAQGRDCTLPGGVKDLVEMIHLREREDTESRQQLLQLKMMMERDCTVHPVRILAVLRQRIDQDLIFAEDFDLVRPRMREIVCELWAVALARNPLYVFPRTRDKVVDLTLEIVRQRICEVRGRYLEQRDGGRLEG